MNIKCNSCDNEAEIFHDEGDFCVQCWNEIK
jgi:ribosomal protein S27E